MSNSTPTPFTRRRLLTWGGAAVATAAAGGLAWQFRPTKTLDFPDTTLGNAAAGQPRLLVAYGSSFGTTAEQALWIGEAASQAGYAVQVAPIETAPRADGFDAVILGSAIRSSKWLPQVVDWAADNRDPLADTPCALFDASMGVAGILQETPDRRLSPDHVAHMDRYRADLVQAVPALAQAPLAHLPGCLDYDLLSPMMRIIFPFAARSLFSGDFRDREMVMAYTTTSLHGFAA